MQLLHVASTDFVNPLVAETANIKCRNYLFVLQTNLLKVNLQLSG